MKAETVTHTNDHDLTGISRAAFVRWAKEREAAFFWPGGNEEPGTLWVEVGPFRCTCGHEERDAGRMWDHAMSGCGESQR